MSQLHEKRDERVAAGWKRGAFISLADHPDIQDELPNKLVTFLEGKKNPRIIPVLYDCALIDDSFDKEPWAQVVVCWEVDQHNGNFVNAKNPRCLHTSATIGNSVLLLEVTAMSFAQVDRESLLECSPDTSIIWNNGRLEQLLDWIAERYRQPTFPDAFNNRLRSVGKRLDAQWKSEIFRKYCAGIYFRLDTFAELSENQHYQLDIIVAVPSHIKGRDYVEFDAKHSQSIIDGLKTRISVANGIRLNSVDIYPESEFTKDIERGYQRFSLEYFSYASKDGDVLLPAEFNSAGW
ncbi:hypothetical protein [Pantoea agglomerans]|uniref:hypothetical protein n=1 Tax=Enterobacter agglomerans TaxID=549 RepID=UPI0011B088A2|nr:hypothetical protein [Pantoea agglomerans]UBN54954.1 hypothetical protein LB453_05115 [Pantoea agglomerans]